VGVEVNEPNPIFCYLSIRWNRCKINCYEL